MANNYLPDVPPTLQPTHNMTSQGGWVPVGPEDTIYPEYPSAPAGQDYMPLSPGAEGFGNLDFLSSGFLLGNIGAPFVIGLAVGYFAKKVLKIALFLGGAAIVFLFVSEYYGITQLSDQGLQSAANTATNMVRDSGGFLMERLSRITAKGVSATAGFFVGLKFG